MFFSSSPGRTSKVMIRRRRWYRAVSRRTRHHIAHARWACGFACAATICRSGRRRRYRRHIIAVSRRYSARSGRLSTARAVEGVRPGTSSEVTMDNKTATLTIGNESWDFDILDGTTGPQVIDISKLYAEDRPLHLRSGLHLDRVLRLLDHLYRRRRGRAPLSRLSDRRARREEDLPGGRLPASLRRAADAGAERRLRVPRHAPHDDP